MQTSTIAARNPIMDNPNPARKPKPQAYESLRVRT